MALHKPKKSREAALVVAALIRTATRAISLPPHPREMILAFIPTCKQCNSILISPIYSPDEEARLFGTECAFNSVTCSSDRRNLCRFCDRICGVPGLPSGPKDPMSEGNPMTFCEGHRWEGTAYFLKGWIHVRDTHNIASYFQATKETGGQSSWNLEAGMSTKELEFRANTAAAITYEYLPQTDPLGVLNSTPLDYLAVRTIYAYTSGQAASLNCFNGFSDTGKDSWPTHVYGGACTFGSGDFGALEFFADFVSGIIRQENPSNGNLDHHALVIITSQVIADYFFERCTCGRLALPGQTMTLTISHVLPPQSTQYFYPCCHTYEIHCPPLPPALKEIEYAGARDPNPLREYSYDHREREMHQDIREECIRFRQGWTITYRPNTRPYTYGYPKLYLEPANIEPRCIYPRRDYYSQFSRIFIESAQTAPPTSIFT